MSSVLSCERVATADTQIDQPSLWAGSSVAASDAVATLARLRADFPHWAFLYDPWAYAWIGVRGKLRIEVTASASELREAILTG